MLKRVSALYHGSSIKLHENNITYICLFLFLLLEKLFMVIAIFIATMFQTDIIKNQKYTSFFQMSKKRGTMADKLNLTPDYLLTNGGEKLNHHHHHQNIQDGGPAAESTSVVSTPVSGIVPEFQRKERSRSQGRLSQIFPYGFKTVTIFYRFSCVFAK